MSLPSEKFPKAEFDGLVFAYSEMTVKGGIRFAPHEFPHVPGAEIEKMGRKAYAIGVRAMFHDIPGSDLAREYPDAYPNGLRTMREKFEVQLSGDLVVPSLGKIRVVAHEWTQKFDVRAPTGDVYGTEPDRGREPDQHRGLRRASLEPERLDCLYA